MKELNFVHDEAHFMLKCLEDEEIVGYLTYNYSVVTYPSPVDADLEICILFVDPKYRGKKIGSELMNMFMTEFKHSTIAVYASPLDDSISQESLHKFYSKFGFKHDENSDDPCCMIRE